MHRTAKSSHDITCNIMLYHRIFHARSDYHWLGGLPQGNSSFMLGSGLLCHIQHRQLVWSVRVQWYTPESCSCLTSLLPLQFRLGLVRKLGDNVCNQVTVARNLLGLSAHRRPNYVSIYLPLPFHTQPARCVPGRAGEPDREVIVLG